MLCYVVARHLSCCCCSPSSVLARNIRQPMGAAVVGERGQWGRYILDPGVGTVVCTGQEHWLSLLMFTAACRYSPGLRTQKSLYRDAVDIIQSQIVKVEITNMWWKKCVLIPCLTSTSTVHYSKALILQKHTQSQRSILYTVFLLCIPCRPVARFSSSCDK